MEHMQLTGMLLAILALLSAASDRRWSSAIAAGVLGLGAAWLVGWQLNPPSGTLTDPPFDWPLWLCAAALAASALAAAADALSSHAVTGGGRPRRHGIPRLGLAGPRRQDV
jgi:hypothetical protein